MSNHEVSASLMNKLLSLNDSDIADVMAGVCLGPLHSVIALHEVARDHVVLKSHSLVDELICQPLSPGVGLIHGMRKELASRDGPRDEFILINGKQGVLGREINKCDSDSIPWIESIWLRYLATGKRGIYTAQLICHYDIEGNVVDIHFGVWSGRLIKNIDDLSGRPVFDCFIG